MGARFIRFDDVTPFALTEGVEGRPLFGDGAMVNVIEFAAGATVPAHSHPHEQLGIVLRGMQALVIDGVAHELGPMEGYVLPGHVEHSAYCGPEGATVIDIFCPVREDYREQWHASDSAEPPAE
jgi:quercetin dioxygenase-like cupin family protein